MVHLQHFVLLFASWNCCNCVLHQGTKCKFHGRFSQSCGSIKDSQDFKCCWACHWNNFDHYFHCDQSHRRVVNNRNEGLQFFSIRGRSISAKLCCKGPPLHHT